MKLLYILSEYLPDSGGGIISHYARILPGLVARGHEVTVVLASKGKLDQPDYEIDGVRVRPLKAKFLEQYSNRFGRWAGLDMFYYLLPVAWAAWAQAQEECDYDLVEVTDWALLFLPWVAEKKRAPVVVSLHGSCGQVDWFGKGEPRSLDGDLVRMVEAAALRGADVVHANSRANAEFWQEKTGREIRVIPPVYAGRDAADGGGLMAESGENRADLTTEDTEDTESEVGPCLDKPSGAVFSNPFTSELARDSENSSLTRSAIGPALAAEPPRADAGGRISDGYEFPKALDSRPSSLDLSSPATSDSLPATAPQALKGLVVGRLQNLKGAEVLCKALELVDGIQIEWVGGDTDWGQSGMMASEYLAGNYPDVFGKRLRWVGRLDRSEVDEKIRAASFLVAPSFLDVFNLTVAEGMEAGLPVICSRAAGAEMLIEHGQSGLLFDPAKPEELADCLRIVAGMSIGERLSMGLKAQEKVKTLLCGERILAMLEKSYTEVQDKDISKEGDPWIAALVSPGSVVEPDLQPPFPKRAIRKIGRILSKF